MSSTRRHLTQGERSTGIPLDTPSLRKKFNYLPPKKQFELLRRTPLFTTTIPFLLLEAPDGGTHLVTGVREINGELRVTGLGGGLTPFVNAVTPNPQDTRQETQPQSSVETWLDLVRINLLREALEELTEGARFLRNKRDGLEQATMQLRETLESYLLGQQTTVRIINWEGRPIIDTLFFPPAASLQPPPEVSRYILQKSCRQEGIVHARPFDVIEALKQTAEKLGISYQALYEGPLSQRLPHLLKVAKLIHEQGLVLTQNERTKAILPPIGFTVADAVIYVLSIVHYVDVNERTRNFSPPGIIYQDSQTFAFSKQEQLFTYSYYDPACPTAGLPLPQTVTLEGFFLNGTPTNVNILPKTFTWAYEVYTGFLQVTEVLETADKLAKQFITNPDTFWRIIIESINPSYSTWFDEGSFLKITKRYLSFLTHITGASKEKAKLYQELAHKISAYFNTLGFALDGQDRPFKTVEDFLEFLKTIKNQIREKAPDTAEEYHIWWTLWLLIFVPFIETILRELFAKVIERPKGLNKLTPFVGSIPPFNPRIEYFRLKRTRNPRRWQILKEQFAKLLEKMTTNPRSKGSRTHQSAPFSPVSTKKLNTHQHNL